MIPGARCPSPVDLERAFWSDEPAVRAHAEDCAGCGAQWAEMAALVQAGRAIEPPASSVERKEELRTMLLSKGARAAPSVPRRPRWLVATPLAAAAAFAFAIAGWAIGKDSAPASEPARPPAVASGPPRRASVLDHDHARYMFASESPDEIIRLVEGTLTLEVDPLRRGERFRVITGDAEVEVRGTAFDVTASADRLVAVRVIHGAVEVRAGDAPPRLLEPGQSWRAAPVTVAAAPATATQATVTDAPLSHDSLGEDAVASREATARRSARPRLDAPLPEAPAGIEPEPEPAPAPEPGPQAPLPPPPARSPAQQAFDEGFRAVRAGDFAAAAESFATVEQVGGEPRVAHDAAFWRSVALARAGRTAAAVDSFRAFLASRPDSPRAGEASAMLGWLLVERGERALAGREFRRALNDPSDRVRRSATLGMRAAAAGR